MRACAVAAFVIVALSTGHVLRAQSAERFEVASVRRVDIAPSAVGVPVFPTVGGVGTGRIAYRGTWLFALIGQAFDVRPDQITGPEWEHTDRYDIVANIPPGTTNEQFKHMLGNLLVDRFHLRFHMEAKAVPVYALRVAKSGPRFNATTRRDDATASSGGSGAPDAQGCPAVSTDFHGLIGRPIAGGMCWTGRDVTMAQLAATLESPAVRPIVDETRLTGHYDFQIRLEWIRRSPDAGLVSNPLPTVFTAVQEQLGLRLESTTHSFPHMVIDSLDREPTEN